MKNYFLILFFFNIICCKNDNSYKTEKIDNLEIQIPNYFQIVETKSIDTKIFDIKSNNKIVGKIYIGEYYKPFSENKIVVDKDLYNDLRNKENFILAIDTLNDVRNGIFNDNFYYYDTINNKIAQIMFPKREKGSIGIYFKNIDNHKNNFAIVSNDLYEENKEIFKKIFESIKFK